MYCKHCGKEIADDSLFCQYCGGKQSELTSNETTRVETETQRKEKVVEIPTIKANISESTKWWICGYCLWVVLNFYWLFAGYKRSYAGKEFLPFTDDIDKWCGVYDITEFVVYVFGVPLIIWGYYCPLNIIIPIPTHCNTGFWMFLYLRQAPSFDFGTVRR